MDGTPSVKYRLVPMALRLTSPEDSVGNATEGSAMEWRISTERRESARLTDDLVGFHVQAHDGDAGKVVYVSLDGTYMVVETGRWIFGRRALVPDFALQALDPARKTAYVGVTKDELENSPDCDPIVDDECAENVRAYYVGKVTRKARNVGSRNLRAESELHGGEEEREGRFSYGQELEGETPEKEREGRFSRGQEEEPRPLSAMFRDRRRA